MKKSAFTILELSIVIIAIALVYGAFQVSKKLISGAENLVALNQSDNDWESATGANNEGGGTPVCSSETGELDITTAEGEAIHIFTVAGSQSLTCTESIVADILVVGAGGSGGNHGKTDCASGGGGGVVYIDDVTLSAETYNFVIADTTPGSISSDGTAPHFGFGINGEDSSFTGTNIAITVKGGGGGAGISQVALDGASGAGGHGKHPTASVGEGGEATLISTATIPDGTAIINSGNDGGDGGPSDCGGGGGGAAAAGSNGVGPAGGSGGAGIAYDITGTEIYYGAGGGGPGESGGGTAGSGGSDSAGDGQIFGSTDRAGLDATANTGSGGGANGSYTAEGGSGGSGIVVVRYTIP